MKRITATLMTLAGLAFLFAGCKPDEPTKPNEYRQSYGIPTVSIVTDNKAPVVTREDHIPCTVKFFKTGASEPEFTSRGIIHTRGNATSGYPKKPYKIKLEEKYSMCGFPANRDCYIKVYTGGYFVKEIHDLSMLDYKGSALQSRETANCYIVSETGYYELPLVYGCGIVDGNTNSASYTQVSGSNTQPFFNYLNGQINSPFIEVDTGVPAVSASVVLTDTADFVIDDVYLTENPLCKFLRFHVSSMPSLGGNATIAVKDENGQIMWSWHIWAYPFTLSTFTHTNTSGNTYNILDVNLGWVKQSADSKKGTSPYYQWGRKDPMLRGNTSASVGSFNVTGCATSVAATIQNPNVFNTKDGTNYNWWTNDGTLVTFYNYWDASQTTTGAGHKSIVKTIYDPCPVGFHIPCGATFTGFSLSNGGTFDNGFTWDNNFFQAAGFRYRENGVVNYVGSYGGYWSAASRSAAGSYLLYFGSGTVNPQNNDSRAYGFSVRPVARS